LEIFYSGANIILKTNVCLNLLRSNFSLIAKEPVASNHQRDDSAPIKETKPVTDVGVTTSTDSKLEYMNCTSTKVSFNSSCFMTDKSQSMASSQCDNSIIPSFKNSSQLGLDKSCMVTFLGDETDKVSSTSCNVSNMVQIRT